MSLIRSGNTITFQCDGERCNDEYDGDSDQFNETLADMKRNGWRVVKDRDGEWCHYCPDCGPKEC